MRRGYSPFSALAGCLLLFMAAALASCIYEYPNCPPESREFRVVFDWDHSEQADVEGMTLFFYPPDESGSIWRFDIPGRDGGCVELPYGQYCMIAFNNDLPGIRLEDTESASTIQAAMKRRDIDDDSVYGSTGMLYNAIVRQIDVMPCGVRYSPGDGQPVTAADGTVSCQPDSLAIQFDVRLTGVKGTERIRSAQVILFGLRASVFLGDGHVSENPAALAINLDINNERNELSGRACGFDAYNRIGDDYRLTLLVTMANGSIMAKHIEITSDNLNVISRHSVLIIVTDIKLPDDSRPGDISGIEADVEGWELINIEVGPTIGNS